MMGAWERLTWVIVLLPSVLVSGCADVPPPRPVYQDPLTSIRLQADNRTSSVHSHPAQVGTEQMAAVLHGVQVVSRRGGIFGSIATGSPQANPAFSSIEIQALAPQLSHALAEAKPHELVTFYRRYSDTGIGLAVTSGALFVQGTHLYFILANNRNMPSDSLNINQVYEIDPIDNPLHPIARNTFRAVFSPGVLLVPSDERVSWPYIDEGRVLVIDLALMTKQMKTTGRTPTP